VSEDETIPSAQGFLVLFLLLKFFQVPREVSSHSIEDYKVEFTDLDDFSDNTITNISRSPPRLSGMWNKFDQEEVPCHANYN
jgi:hypothetical protein